MEIQFHLQTIKAVDLPEASRPVRDLAVTDQPVYGYELETFRQVAIQFEKTPDPILTGIFKDFFPDEKFDIPLVATAGVPAPYDAWTAPLGDDEAIFFNLSQWNVAEIQRDARSILLHEVSHILMKPVVSGFYSDDLLLRLDLQILDEGLAHFIGCAFPRESLLTEHFDKWAPAEEALEKAKMNLISPHLTYEEKEELLQSGVTGSFWEKFTAVSGMFRAASLFNQSGVAGIHQALREKRLPSPGHA